MYRFFTPLAVLLWLLLATPALALEFQALSVMNLGGGLTAHKTYVKGDLMRNDLPEDRYQIIDRAKKKLWLVIPDQKAYLEKDLTDDELPRLDGRLGGEVKRMKVGAEEISGMQTTKYLVILQQGSQRVRVFQWIAPELGLPVRTKAAEGHWETGMRDIKIGPVQDSWFVVPAEYMKVDQPGVGPLRSGEDQEHAEDHKH